MRVSPAGREMHETTLTEPNAHEDGVSLANLLLYVLQHLQPGARRRAKAFLGPPPSTCQPPIFLKYASKAWLGP